MGNENRTPLLGRRPVILKLELVSFLLRAGAAAPPESGLTLAATHRAVSEEEAPLTRRAVGNSVQVEACFQSSIGVRFCD